MIAVTMVMVMTLTLLAFLVLVHLVADDVPGHGTGSSPDEGGLGIPTDGLPGKGTTACTDEGTCLGIVLHR